MDPARWQRIKDLVARAMELPPQVRKAFVEREAGDPELAAEALRLVEAQPASGLVDPPSLAAEDQPLSGGLRLGEFEIVRELGHGGMGVVYLAHQPKLRRDVAIKVLVASLSTTERQIERFHREAEAAARLQHPAIVQVFAHDSAGATHWFAMELVEGHDLRREIALQVEARPGRILPAFGGPGRAVAIARLAAEVADGLQYAHGKGLIHRDVKPSNLLLQPDGRVRIVDFGLARDEALEELTRTGEMAGSPHYMSPEQTRLRQVRIDARTDVFSLGVVLYELLTLRKPFDGATAGEIFSQIREVEPRAIRAIDPSVPRDLEVVCQTAMAKDPARRYASAGALADDLRRFVNHEAIVARPASLPERSRRWAWRHRRPLVALLLLAAGLAVGLILSHQARLGETTARIVVRLAPRGEARTGAVSLRSIDMELGTVGPREPRGSLPLQADGLRPGYYRVLVELGPGELREFTRLLEAGQQEEIELAPLAGEGSPSDRAARREHGMVWIEGGTLALRDERALLVPQNGRDLRVEGYWLDEAEVSVGAYRAFVQASGYPAPRNWSALEDRLHEDFPMVGVSWRDALAYAEWAGKRLPSFVEWTWAARGAENRRFPWGDEDDAPRGNTRRPADRASDHDFSIYPASLEAVRTHDEARTPSGLYHMFGNASEWTESVLGWRDLEVHEPDPLKRLIVGHAWDASLGGRSLETFAFAYPDGSNASNHIGFRCAMSAQLSSKGR